MNNPLKASVEASAAPNGATQTNNIIIRRAEFADADQIWAIIQPVIAGGDTYVFAPDSDKESMLAYWCHPDKHTFVALIDDQIVGTFIIKSNFPGLGAHVANASYMTAPSAEGRGVGTTMARYSLEEARRLGYHAMQFNIVIKSNERAVRLWKKLGFEIKGEIPDAFNHQRDGLTNAYVMWRRL